MFRYIYLTHHSNKMDIDGGNAHTQASYHPRDGCSQTRNDTPSLETSVEDTHQGANTNNTFDIPRTPPPPRRSKYIGYRKSTGSLMPNGLRDETIRAMLDPIIWAFGCRMERPRSQPKLQVGTIQTNVDYGGLVYRTPMDRAKNRAGVLEGPAMAVQCRGGTTFGDENLSMMDLLREIGAMLAVAQERAREGKKEVIPGEGKWWAETRRWGGGDGEAVGTPLFDDEPEAPRPSGEPSNVTNDGPPLAKKRSMQIGRERRTKEQRAAQRKKLTAQSYEKPSSTWDKRVEYSRLGKAKDQVFDEVSTSLSLLLLLLPIPFLLLFHFSIAFTTILNPAITESRP